MVSSVRESVRPPDRGVGVCASNRVIRQGRRGESGSGKSTTARMLAGLIVPTAVEVRAPADEEWKGVPLLSILNV
jgi:ABC-type proline/glycine betaine transport system ATPase subunit